MLSPRTAVMVLVLVVGASLAAAPAGAFDYVVEGLSPQVVTVDDELLVGGAVAASVGYLLPLAYSGIQLAVAGDPVDAHNAGIGVMLATPPLAGGVLLGVHQLDVASAGDAREGFSALPAMLVWGASGAQLVGLILVGVAFLSAERAPPVAE